jgi:hypothetical protein
MSGIFPFIYPLLEKRVLCSNGHRKLYYLPHLWYIRGKKTMKQNQRTQQAKDMLQLLKAMQKRNLERMGVL